MSRVAAGALLVAVAFGVGAPGAAAQTAEPMSRQKSSHEAAFFNDLLTGRVWVYQKRSVQSASMRVHATAAYFHADGRLTVCSATESGGIDQSGSWRVVPSEDFVAQYNFIPPGEEPDPLQARGHVPLFYDARTGGLHSEDWESDDTWRLYLRGWVQESWPAAFASACPDLTPAGVPLNGRQESVLFRRLALEDPEAAVRRYPGSEAAIPGATGLAASGHEPTYPPAALRAWLAENNGTVVRGGVLRYVPVLGPRGDEMWVLGPDADEVVDTIVLTPSDDGEGVVLQFTGIGLGLVYSLGYPLGLLPTGERFGAMALTDWLVERGERVGLPFMDRESVGFRFLGNASLRVETRGGLEIGGEWWWSGGMLHVRVDGIDAVNTFEWRALAHHVGWSGEDGRGVIE